MARVNLTRRFDWRVPGKRSFKRFNPGSNVLMTHVQAQDAVSQGYGTLVAATLGDPLPEPDAAEPHRKRNAADRPHP